MYKQILCKSIRERKVEINKVKKIKGKAKIRSGRRKLGLIIVL